MNFFFCTHSTFLKKFFVEVVKHGPKHSNKPEFWKSILVLKIVNILKGFEEKWREKKFLLDQFWDCIKILIKKCVFRISTPSGDRTLGGLTLLNLPDRTVSTLQYTNCLSKLFVFTWVKRTKSLPVVWSLCHSADVSSNFF